MAEDEPGTGARRSEHRGTWIAAGAAVVAALIGAVATTVAARSGDGGESGAPPAASAPSAAELTQEPSSGGEDDAAPAEDTPEPSAPDPSATESSVRWEGDVVFDGSGKDFDASPPVGAAGSNDFGTGGAATVELHVLGGSLLSTWDGEETPDHADCAESAAAEGVGTHPLEIGTVLCGVTDEGRVVRLTVVEFPDQYGPYAAFEAVVWESA
ncbi:hypothetical protein SAMN06297387_12229 [Streptomyces zhaozhouensis]|uniref:Uncharacterized protein n=1 Tax=Streptomyces zhaozhouensis TaxID=1300267 RepID=A0A286E3L4_9ACTN|nr:hypothetical protein [Streptomyces zhaozhouensis]SOD65492.1 hypothetical protein SAMN06297387_12229 [Streptomyces zhaozhouensis]